MVKDDSNSTDEYDMVIGSIQRNYHLLQNSNTSKFYKFNNRILLSNSTEFLSAVKSDIGGEIISDSTIGSFLFFGDDKED